MSHWEDDPDFDLSRHLRRATLAAPGDQEALVPRFHHSLADGIALSQVLLSLTNDSPTVDLEAINAQESPSAHS